MADEQTISQRFPFATSGAGSVGPAGPPGPPGPQGQDGSSGPYVDLRVAPYSVVADDPTRGEHNTGGILDAIAKFTGTGARLDLPPGDIRIGRNGTSSGAIKFGAGVSDLTFRGQGMYATMLTVDDTSFGGDWHGLLVDGASRLELFGFGIRQISDLGVDGQQHHLIRTAVTGVAGATRDIFYHHIFFGSGGQLCDAYQIFGNTGVVTNVRLLDFHMALQGIGAGSRSGIALQRGYSQIEIGNGHLRGAKNSLLDMESTGSATIEYAFLHDLVLDNSLGQTSVAMSISGVDNGANVQHARVRDVTVLSGRVTISDTDDLHVQRLTVCTSQAWAADTASPNVQVFQDNNNLVLEDLSLARTGTAAAGNLLDIQDTGTDGVTIRGGLFVQATDAYPIYSDGTPSLKITGTPRIFYSGASAARAGVLASAVSRSSDDVQIDGIDLTNTSPGGALRSIVDLESRTGRTMNRIRVGNLDGHGSVTNGVYLSDGAGSTMDPTPCIGTVRGCVTPWKQVDQGDNPIATLFPCISGSPSDIATFVGDATPEGALAAKQGSFCIQRAGDGTILFFKPTGTGNTGWSALAGPGP